MIVNCKVSTQQYVYEYYQTLTYYDEYGYSGLETLNAHRQLYITTPSEECADIIFNGLWGGTHYVSELFE